MNVISKIREIYDIIMLNLGVQYNFLMLKSVKARVYYDLRMFIG